MKWFFRLVLLFWVPALLSVATAQEGAILAEPRVFDFDERAPSLIKFRSEPEGATVLVDSKVFCKTPCSKEMAEGQYDLLVRASKYDSYSQRLIVNGKQTVSVRLSPRFGWLLVFTSPPGIAIAVDGKVVGKTPLRTVLSPGEYDVLISDERWLPSGERVTIEKGLERRIEVKALQRQGGLVVRAVDDKGNALDLPVRLDGQRIGETPLRKKVQVGQYSLLVGSINRRVRIVDSVVEEVLVKLPQKGSGEGSNQNSKAALFGEPILDPSFMGGIDPSVVGGISGGGNFGPKGEGGIGRIGGDPIILGALDKSLIDRVINKNMNQIKYCYSRQLNANPTLNGKIVVKFVISGDGSVSQAKTHSSTMTGGSAVQSCINQRFVRFQFPEPKGGGIVIVKYPFLFAPK
jgi:hypothetical protein